MTDLFIDLLIGLFYLLVYLLICLFIHLLIYLLINLFIYLFIYFLLPSLLFFIFHSLQFSFLSFYCPISTILHCIKSYSFLLYFSYLLFDLFYFTFPILFSIIFILFLFLSKFQFFFKFLFLVLFSFCFLLFTFSFRSKDTTNLEDLVKNFIKVGQKINDPIALQALSISLAKLSTDDKYLLILEKHNMLNPLAEQLFVLMEICKVSFSFFIVIFFFYFIDFY